MPSTKLIFLLNWLLVLLYCSSPLVNAKGKSSGSSGSSSSSSSSSSTSSKSSTSTFSASRTRNVYFVGSAGASTYYPVSRVAVFIVPFYIVGVSHNGGVSNITYTDKYTDTCVIYNASNITSGGNGLISSTNNATNVLSSLTLLNTSDFYALNNSLYASQGLFFLNSTCNYTYNGGSCLLSVSLLLNTLFMSIFGAVLLMFLNL
mmetsp:Transcript_22003/g.39224  ORF Transcript_22003/g.39224 Transcript_22003/m.39224 type:complete len:204 (+) Transcript_22003:64-675(+)